MTQSSPSTVLSVAQSLLVVIDVQERLLPVIQNHQCVAASIRFLMDAAAILKVSAVVTEQYPKGLGTTVELLRNHPVTVATLEKLQFSAVDALIQDSSVSSKEHSRSSLFGFKMQPDASLSLTTSIQPCVIPAQIVLAGIETHICVQQTALELFDRGFQVFVAADCVGSRYADDHDRALQRMAQAGVIITTAEAIAFEWCERAGHDSFKALSRLVRDRDLQRSRSTSAASRDASAPA